jgi:hypothetical protein
MKATSIQFVCAVLFVSFLSLRARADVALDLGATFSSDSLSTASEAKNSQTFYNLSALFNLDSKMQWNVGWTVFGISQNSSASSVDTQYSSFDMGPAFRWNMDKRGIFSFTLVYGYLAKGKYSSGSTSEEWDGSSLLLQLAALAPIQEDKFFVGLSLNSYSANYTEKTVSNVKSAVTAKKSWLFPMVTMTWRL